MTVIEEYKEYIEVQFCLMSLLALAFHQLRLWCRRNPCFHALLDPNFEEPSTEELKVAIVIDSMRYMTKPLTEDVLEVLFKRSNHLFQNFVKLFFLLYP